MKLEATGNENELLAERLRQTEKDLSHAHKEATNYQNMLQQSQSQFTTIERKYNKAKRLVREYQQREVDMVRPNTIILIDLIEFKHTKNLSIFGTDSPGRVLFAIITRER